MLNGQRLLDQLNETLGEGSEEDRLGAVRMIEPSCEVIAQADAWLWALVWKMLRQNALAAVAKLIWPHDLFNAEPDCVKRIWNGIYTEPKLILLGCGSAGKSYSSVAWFLLDWLRDPYYTNTKVISSTAGHAKCFGAGTGIRMSDGSVKFAENVRIGDFLMGPDSMPRKVENITSGHEMMYSVKPLRGPGFVCNASHLLYLENVAQCHLQTSIISVSDYVNRSRCFKKENKMAREGFELPQRSQRFDPYIVGLWLGDGHTNAPALTNMDGPVVEAWKSYFELRGYHIRKYSNGSKADTYFAFFGEQGRRDIENPFRSFLRMECLENGVKRIPLRIMRSSAAHRWSVLAGILDTDGGVNQGGFTLTVKSKPLARDVLDLCHSLGLNASKREVKRKSQHGTEGSYQTLQIRGDFCLLPTLVKKPHKVRTNQRAVPFTVAELPVGQYFGFTVNGDHCFLLETGIIAHNSNVFSTFNTLHSRSRVRLPGIVIDGFIGMDTKNRLAGISRVSIPAGATGRAALQGFHPIPRGDQDPIFGKVGRVRALVDEAEEVPIGLWKGINNMLLSMQGRDRIKVVAACNPTDVLSPLAGQAQPDKGWTRVQLDIDKEWISRERWKVIRIDGADLENVVQRREIYPGFMTFEGYENLRLKAGGNTPEYHTMARGMYPLEGTANTVIPLSFLDGITGTLLFTGRVIPVGSLDVAFEGDDEVILCAARYGQAAGWREPHTGKVNYFDKPRYCFQVDQFFALAKGRTDVLAERVMDQCEKLGITPEWFLCDRTGVGTGLHDLLIALWDADVAGINWGESATDKPILEDDTHLAIEECDGVSTEMHMALRRWVEFSYIKLSPTLDQDKVIKEMTQRKYGLTGKGPTDLARVRVQPKKEFKALYGWSPDRCDAMVMGLHHVRMLGPERARAAMTSKPRQRRGAIGVIEKGRYVAWDPKIDS